METCFTENIYNGIYRLDSPSPDGMPNQNNSKDFSFIRVKLNKKFLWFHKYENWRPTSFPSNFQLPKDPLGRLRNFDKSPRFFKMTFKARLNEYSNVSQPILLLRMRMVEIVEVIDIIDLDCENEKSFKL